LLGYRRVVKQRNKILLDARITRQDPGEAIEPWSKGLVEHGTQLIVKRREFLKEFTTQVADAFQRLTGEQETPMLNYAPSVTVDEQATAGEIADRFMQSLTEQFTEERRAGTTLVGPHRDEIEFSINKRDLRKYASQGQHKTFLVALKVAEFHYLKEQCNETPLLLLDDVFSELDEHRSHRLLNMVGELGQTFITSTSEQVFSGALEWGNGARKFLVKQGAVTHEEAGKYVH
jgi:DNA replication and repair protein RecF